MTPEEINEGATNEATPEIAEIEDVETLRQLVTEEKARAESNLANWQRAQADFINYKRRSEQEREEIRKFANATLMLSLLPVLDDLERAFNSAPSELADLAWVEGIKLIERKLRSNLEAQGLSPIEALGKPFDPNFHEAVRQSKGKEGIVVDEVQKGYMLHDRIIRPAMVVVGSGQKKKQKEED